MVKYFPLSKSNEGRMVLGRRERNNSYEKGSKFSFLFNSTLFTIIKIFVYGSVKEFSLHHRFGRKMRVFCVFFSPLEGIKKTFHHFNIGFHDFL